MKKIVVTGGLGALGAPLCRKLLSEGHEVRILDNDFRGGGRKVDGAEVHIGDVRVFEDLATAANGADCMAHLAYVNGTERFYSQPEVVLDVAVNGMTNVLDVCKHHGIRDLLLFSTSEVYQTPSVIPTPEDVPLTVPDVMNPRYSYGGGKILCELLALHSKLFDRVLIVRPHNVYGPDMGHEHVIPQLIMKVGRSFYDSIGSGEPPIIKIQGDGSQRRSFVYVDDFVESVVRILESGTGKEIYHLGTMDETTVSHLLSKICDVAKPLCPQLEHGYWVETSPEPEGGTRRRCPDNRKVLALFPDLFCTTLEEGLQETVTWYLQNRHLWPEEKQ